MVSDPATYHCHSVNPAGTLNFGRGRWVPVRRELQHWSVLLWRPSCPSSSLLGDQCLPHPRQVSPGTREWQIVTGEEKAAGGNWWPKHHSPCSALNKNVWPRLRCLHTCSPVACTVWKCLGGVAFLEEVCHGSAIWMIIVSSHIQFAPTALYLWLKMWTCRSLPLPLATMLPYHGGILPLWNPR